MDERFERPSVAWATDACAVDGSPSSSGGMSWLAAFVSLVAMIGFGTHTLVSALAGLIPAHRTSRIEPILALRYE